MHSHDVEIIWYVYPFSLVLWKPFKDFLQGHGMNWLNNIAWDVLWFPITIWNTIIPALFGRLDWVFNILNWLPNTFFGIISNFIFFLPNALYSLWKAI